MDKKISVKALVKEVKTSPFLLYCELPMGYVEGLPILQIRNGQLCIMIPFLKYQVTGKVDQTLVYPIHYTVTVLLPEGKIMGYQDVSVLPHFSKVDFTKPVGLFRHEAIKQWGKKEYAAKREELFSMYDKVANALLYGDDYTEEDEAAMRNLLQIMVEPSQLPIYKVLDEDFYDKYLV